MPNPFIRRSHKGNTPAGNLLSDITSGALAFTLRAGQGANFPDGSVGPFVVKFNRGSSTEEKVLCASRAVDAFTVAAGGRGYDDTLPSAQTANFTVEHVGSAVELDEANLAVVNTIGRIAAVGDMLIGAGANLLAKVGIGLTGQVWTVVGGTGAWATPATPAVASALLAVASYNPAANTFVTVTSAAPTFAAFDTANLTIPFTTTASGLGSTKVLVRVTAAIASNGANIQSYLALGAHNSVTPITGTAGTISVSNTTWDVWTRSWVVTGLSPSTATQYDLLGASSSGSLSVGVGQTAGSPIGPAVIEVWAA